MNANPARILKDEFYRGFALVDPMLSVDEWANRHRMLSSVASAEPGRWSTQRTPYLAESWTRSPKAKFERVVFMKGGQIGGTEVGLNCGICGASRAGPHAPCAADRRGAVKRVSKQRIAALIERQSGVG